MVYVTELQIFLPANFYPPYCSLSLSLLLSIMINTENWVGTWRPHRPRGPIAALCGSPGPKYALPGLTGTMKIVTWPFSIIIIIMIVTYSVCPLFNKGFSNHDPTKCKAPMFSIGSHHKQANLNCSPGPKYLMQSSITRKGRDGTPAFSLYNRRKEPRLSQTPGPG